MFIRSAFGAFAGCQARVWIVRPERLPPPAAVRGGGVGRTDRGDARLLSRCVRGVVVEGRLFCDEETQQQRHEMDSLLQWRSETESRQERTTTRHLFCEFEIRPALKREIWSCHAADALESQASCADASLALLVCDVGNTTQPTEQ
eukprot:SAG31_NODE_2466_length_5652_cov_16.202773_3_plen_146_part_00